MIRLITGLFICLSFFVKAQNNFENGLKELAVNGRRYYQKKLDTTIQKILIIDYSLPSDKRRFYLWDFKGDTMLMQSLVAHGKNTGDKKAKFFSNISGSKQSSLGFFTVMESYNGKHGLSFRLDGLEKKINDKARSRGIVIHEAWYVCDDMANKYGRIGRSHGCPALSKSDFKRFTQIIDHGTLLFIYYPDKTYFRESKVFKNLPDSFTLPNSN